MIQIKNYLIGNQFNYEKKFIEKTKFNKILKMFCLN